LFSFIKEKTWDFLIGILTKKEESASLSPNDLECLKSSIKAGDVLLIEGRSRVGYIIKSISRSSWSHAAFCIGSLNSIKDPELFALVAEHWNEDADEPLLVESEIDRGTVVTPLSHYSTYHMRICRPIGLTKDDRSQVVEYMVSKIGTAYSVHHLLDLARFLIPWWTIIPRSWHSSLFEHNAGESTKAVCSSMIAQAFSAVDFPILPLIQEDEQGSYRLFRRNPRLFTPRDFDYSPFFDVIKCPLLRSETNRWGKPRTGYYRKLVWVDYPDQGDDMHDLASAHDVIHVRPEEEGLDSDAEGLSSDAEGSSSSAEGSSTNADGAQEELKIIQTPIAELDVHVSEEELPQKNSENQEELDPDGE